MKENLKNRLDSWLGHFRIIKMSILSELIQTVTLLGIF